MPLPAHIKLDMGTYKSTAFLPERADRTGRTVEETPNMIDGFWHVTVQNTHLNQSWTKK